MKTVFRVIVVIFCKTSPAVKISTGQLKHGQWVGLIFLTLSDISAEILTCETKKTEPLLALPNFLNDFRSDLSDLNSESKQIASAEIYMDIRGYVFDFKIRAMVNKTSQQKNLVRGQFAKLNPALP